MTAVAVDAMLPLLAVVSVVANLSNLGTCLFAPAIGFPMAESLDNCNSAMGFGCIDR